MGKQRDKGEKRVKVQENGEKLDQPISENTKRAGIPKGVIQGHLRYVN